MRTRFGSGQTLSPAGAAQGGSGSSEGQTPPGDGGEASRLLGRVDRGIAELRLGALVRVEAGTPADDQAPSVIALAGESVTAAGLEALATAAPGSARVALTGRRAAVLGMCGPQTAPVAVTLAAPLSPEAVIRLADPCEDGAGPLPEIASVTPLPPSSPAAAAVQLAKLARLLPAAVIVEETSAPEPVPSVPGVPAPLTLKASDILAYQDAAARSLRQVGEARVPLAGAEDARILAFRPADGGTDHLAILIGQPDPAHPVLVRLHSECFTGDLLGSLRCDCGDQLRGAIEAIAAQGSGVVLYLAQEGRGIGLVNKLRAYQLQDQGFDTLDANGQLGFDDDERIYLPAVRILELLGLHRVRLLTNNPEKLSALARHGLEVVERVPLIFAANPHSFRYLETKAKKGGHLF